MKTKRVVCVCALIGLWTAALQTRADITWRSDVPEGYYSEATNWVGGIVPTNGMIGLFTGNQDYVVRFPAGGLIENSATRVGGLSSGRSIAFDTRGTWWLKSGPDAWPNDWTGFQMQNGSGSHFFNLEGLIKTPPANGYPILFMSNALFSVQSKTAAVTSVLEQGFMNIYDAGGATNTGHSLITGSANTSSLILFKTNTSLRANTVRLRGNVYGHQMRFEGGSHESFGGISIGDGNATGSGVTNALQVSGGNLYVRGGSLYVGYGKSGSYANLTVEGSGAVEAKSSLYVACFTTNLSASLSLRDTGRLYVGGEVRFCDTAQTRADVSLTNAASLSLAAALIIANGNLSTAVVDVADSASLSVTGAVEVARGSGASGSLKLRGSTSAYMGSTLSVGGSNGSGGYLAVQDNATLTVKGATIYVGNNNGTGRLEVAGGQLVATNSSLYFAGLSGTGLFSGGQTAVKTLEVSPSVNGQTNTLLITGGSHQVVNADVNASGVIVGYGARTGILDMRDGLLTVTRLLRIGYGTTGASALPCLRLSGGQLAIVPNSGNENVINVADSADSRGRVELVGGTLKAQAVRGWSGSQLKGGTGWTEFYANGGTLVATNASSSKNLLETFDKAELGPTGLVVNSGGADVVVNQAFADAPGAEGLFLKAGAGVLSVSNSAHARSVIAQGGLRLLAPSASFGRSLAITNQSTLSLAGPAVTLTVRDLTIGASHAQSLLYLDAGDTIVVTNSNGLTLDNCGLVFGGVNSNDTFTLFRCAGSLGATAITNLSLANPTPGKKYTFAVVPDGADSAVRLTVGDYTASESVWNGSQGTDWKTADNWTPSGVPDFGTYALFPGDASSKTVNLPSPANCTYLRFDSATPYLLQGSQLTMPAGGISNALGSHTLAMPLALSGTFSVQAGNSSTAAVSGAISASTGTLLSKSGSGTLTVSGNNSGFGGAWKTSGGRLNFASAEAWGVASSATDAITVGAGTLTYSGPSAAVTKGLTLNAGGTSNAAILDAQSDLSVNGKVSNQLGVFCKRGDGALTLDVGTGTSTLSSGNGSGSVNTTPSGAITLPDNGDAPATATGLGGFNVLEGTLRIKGNGAGVSTVNQQHFGIIGSSFAASQANPVLELDAVRMNQGGSGLHFLIGNQLNAASPARTPTLRLVNGAALYVDTLKLGNSPATAFSPTLIMSNSALNASWQINIGADNYSTITSVVRLTQGSVATASGGSVWGGGVYVSRNVDVLVTSNSVLAQTGVGGSFRCSDYASSGTMRWENGGTMRFTQYQGNNYLTTRGLNLVFNGGVLEPIASGYSYSTAADKQSFIVEAGGLTIRAGNGIRHSFHFPFTGTGVVTKAGAGEIVFGEGLNYTPSLTNLTGLATGNTTGGTLVQEGTLTVSNGTIRADAVVAIAAGAKFNLSGGSVTLGEISGSGMVTNGVLTADYRCHVSATTNDCIALANVTVPSGLTVTFDPASGYALTNRQVLAVATRSGAADLNLALWKARNVGEGLGATFTLVSNTVYAHVAFTGGTLLRIK